MHIKKIFFFCCKLRICTQVKPAFTPVAFAEILGIINKSCQTVKLINDIEDLGDVIDIIINQNHGTIEKITYNIKGFKEPLVRKIDVSDSESANRFINKIKEDKNKKEDLSKLYGLSKYRETTICASNQDKLDKEQVESYKSMAVTAAGKQYNYLHDFN